jgi:hypothetical protein
MSNLAKQGIAYPVALRIDNAKSNFTIYGGINLGRQKKTTANKRIRNSLDSS